MEVNAAPDVILADTPALLDQCAVENTLLLSRLRRKEMGGGL